MHLYNYSFAFAIVIQNNNEDNVLSTTYNLLLLSFSNDWPHDQVHYMLKFIITDVYTL